MHLWAQYFAVLNGFVDFEIGIRFEGSGCSDRGHSGSEVESGKAVRHFAERARPDGIKHVVVHADDPGDDGVSMKIEHLRVFWNTGGRGVGDGVDLTVTED